MPWQLTSEQLWQLRESWADASLRDSLIWVAGFLQLWLVVAHTSAGSKTGIEKERNLIGTFLLQGEALSAAEDAMTKSLPTPESPECTSLSESSQIQLPDRFGMSILARVCLFSTEATPSGSAHCVLLHHHTWLTM